MSQFVEGNTKAFTAGEAIPVNRRVALQSSGKVLLAGDASVAAGVAITPSFADGDDLSVSLRTASGTQKMVASGAITRGVAVFGAAAGKVASSGSVYVGTALEDATADNDVIEVLPGPNTDVLAGAGLVQHSRTRVTTAQVNAGFTLLPAVAGRAYRITDIAMIAIGGNAATATGVLVRGTQAAAVVKLLDAKVGGLTQSRLLRAGEATNGVILADGASFVPNDANTAITVIKDGSDLATATNVDVLVSYVLA